MFKAHETPHGSEAKPEDFGRLNSKTLVDKAQDARYRGAGEMTREVILKEDFTLLRNVYEPVVI